MDCPVRPRALARRAAQWLTKARRSVDRAAIDPSSESCEVLDCTSDQEAGGQE